MDELNINWDNYTSPVQIIKTQMRTEFENGILKAIQDVGIIVDKDELVKAMQYDREQYDKGYKQGVLDGIQKGRREALEELKDAMYHEAFEVSHENDGMQRWDGGNWIRYKLFEKIVHRLEQEREKE